MEAWIRFEHNSWRHSMTFDFGKIQQSKREFRQRLAAQPIVEKLAMLDALRERALAIRPARPPTDAGILREEPPSCLEEENNQNEPGTQ